MRLSHIKWLCEITVDVLVVIYFAVGLLAASRDVVQPFVLGCDTKNPKIVQLSLVAVQRLISQQLLNRVKRCVLNAATVMRCNNR